MIWSAIPATPVILRVRAIMAKEIRIELTESEKMELEYHNFQYQGMRILVEQFLSNASEYDEEHYRRLIDTYCDMYTKLQKCIYNLLSNYKFKNISVSDFDYFINRHEIVIRWR